MHRLRHEEARLRCVEEVRASGEHRVDAVHSNGAVRQWRRNRKTRNISWPPHAVESNFMSLVALCKIINRLLIHMHPVLQISKRADDAAVGIPKAVGCVWQNEATILSNRDFG